MSAAGPHFGFTKLVVADLESAAAFYTGVFGLTETARVSADIGGRPIDEIMFAATGAGGGTFVLLRFADRPKPSADEVIIGFVVTGIDDLFARGVDAGGTVVQPVTDMAQHGVRVGFLADPEGHLIEVVEPLARP